MVFSTYPDESTCMNPKVSTAKIKRPKYFRMTSEISIVYNTHAKEENYSLIVCKGKPKWSDSMLPLKYSQFLLHGDMSLKEAHPYWCSSANQKDVYSLKNRGAIAKQPVVVIPPHEI